MYDRGAGVAVIRVSEAVKRELVRYAAELQAKLGRKVSLDMAISFLLREVRVRRPNLLFEACVEGDGEEALRVLYSERAGDEERARRRYGF
ncbi:MAG: hypothetical protein DRN96_06455 [Thermoproteota archaeon]|nr:MAG: hypothetical protein DRN96_06455 [Candidatus Korarchaeota archaeon]